ncbi:MAG: hypothetical protein ACLP59_21675 [Bryobacteraceae bacterium]
MRKWLPIALLCAGSLLAQSYEGPRPPKPDIPYLMHADNLLPTESVEAKQEGRSGDVVFAIDGATSTARTPLGSPVFLIQTDNVQADRLQCYKLQSKNGRREVLLRHKNKVVARPIRLNVTRVAEGLYKLEVDEILENGEYGLSPTDSNQVFCFEVY